MSLGLYHSKTLNTQKRYISRCVFLAFGCSILVSTSTISDLPTTSFYIFYSRKLERNHIENMTSRSDSPDSSSTLSPSSDSMDEKLAGHGRSAAVERFYRHIDAVNSSSLFMPASSLLSLSLPFFSLVLRSFFLLLLLL